jgi:drug/metabolite transporter (DMT)-like permease
MTGRADRATAQRLSALVVVGALATGTSSTLMALADTSASTTTFYRCVYALPVLALVAARARSPRTSELPRRAAVAAGVLLGVDLVLWDYAITDLGAGLSTVVQDTQVLFVAAAAWLFLGDHISRRTVLLLPLVLLGVALVGGAAGAGTGGQNPVRGTVLALLSAAAYAGFILLLARCGSGDTHRAQFLLVATAATAGTAVMAGVFDGGLQLAPQWPSHGWLLLLALVTQVLGWLVIAASMAQVSAVLASVALLLQPVAAVVYARLLLDEIPNATQLVGVVVVLAGVGLIAVNEHRVANVPVLPNVREAA